MIQRILETTLAWFLGIVGVAAFSAFIWGVCATMIQLGAAQ